MEVHAIGTIDKSKYAAITDEIRTDEVIITEERINHIRDRRGNEFYEKYHIFFADIVTNPDYIFKDSKENTALVCKRVTDEAKYVNIVLRIAIVTDNPEYKNSIMTAIGESEKRFQQRLRNNMPLYKKE